MAQKQITTSELRKMRVIGGKKGTKRIGKVKASVFHPTEKRCVGFIVKRPDFLWMFHRKDLFVALDGFDFVDGRIRIRPDADTTGKSACRRMGISWDDCVLWEGMPLVTRDGTSMGVIGNITMSLEDGSIENVEVANSAASKYFLGALEVPGDMLLGFKRGIGVDLARREEVGEVGEEQSFKGAIVVSDEVWELSPEGGWAEAAGELTASVSAKAHEAKPTVDRAAKKTGEVLTEGAYAVGRQVDASKGMFSAFKEEYNKARYGEEDAEAEGEDELAETEDAQAVESQVEAGEVPAADDASADEAAAEDAAAYADEDEDAGEAVEAEDASEEEADEVDEADEEVEQAEKPNMFVDFKEAFQAARDGEEEEEPEEKEKNMFVAFKEAFDEARGADTTSAAEEDADEDAEDEDELDEEYEDECEDAEDADEYEDDSDEYEDDEEYDEDDDEYDEDEEVLEGEYEDDDDYEYEDDDEYEDEEPAEKPKKSMFAAFKDAYDDALNGEEYDDSDEEELSSKAKDLFGSIRDEYRKGRYDD